VVETPNSDFAMKPDPFRIQHVWKETKDTFSVELTDLQPRRPFLFCPGQFNMVYVYGVGEIPISISGDPSDSRHVIHTTRAVGVVTKALQTLRRGDVVGIRGPFGSPWPVAEAEGSDVVIVAGGIGLAPLRPVLYRIIERREKYGSVVLLYGARTPADILFRKELERLRSRLDIDVHVTVDRALVQWRGNVGVVSAMIARGGFDPQSTVAMLCGPEIMMRFSVAELTKKGISDDSIYVSLERNMKCGCGLCGHCQLQKYFICKDGPVFPYVNVSNAMAIREL